MTSEPTPLPSLADTLPRDVYHDLVHTLRATLLPPTTDSPEDLLRRDRVAIAQVAALLPANAAEAHLAATFVAANTYALDCIRLTRAASTAPDMAARCAAQSVSMSRQAQGAFRTLLQAQAARRKIEATNASADRAAWTEHCALQLMAQALPDAPPNAEPAPPAPAPEPPQAAAPTAPTKPAAKPVRQPIGEAELYAMLYPQRAALIRRHGGVPADARFGPPEDGIVHALVTGRTASLPVPDQPPRQSRAA